MQVGQLSSGKILYGPSNMRCPFGIHHIECTLRTCSAVQWEYILDLLVSNKPDQYVQY